MTLPVVNDTVRGKLVEHCTSLRDEPLSALPQRRHGYCRMFPSGGRLSLARGLIGFLIVALNLLAGLGAGPVFRTDTTDVATSALAEALGVANDDLAICSKDGTALLDGTSPARHGTVHGPACAFCVPLFSGGVSAPIATEPVSYPSSIRLGRQTPQLGGPSVATSLTIASRPRAPPLGSFV